MDKFSKEFDKKSHSSMNSMANSKNGIFTTTVKNLNENNMKEYLALHIDLESNIYPTIEIKSIWPTKQNSLLFSKPFKMKGCRWKLKT